MTKMINIKRVLKIFFALDLTVILSSLYFGFDFFINSQAGFSSSFLVSLTSIISYKNAIENRVANVETNKRDILNEIEDPYGVYDETNEQNAEEKLKIKRSAKERVEHLKLSVGGFFSVYRMVGYLIFFVIFLAVVKSGKFSILPFLIGVSITPLTAVLYGFFDKSKK